MMRENIWKKIFYFPLTRIIIGLIVCGLFITGGQLLMNRLFAVVHVPEDYRILVSAVVVAAISISSYIILFKWYEKRKITELSGTGLLKGLIAGLVLGTVLQGLTILVMFLGGGYSVISVNPVSFILPALAMGIVSAVSEEILFRGIMFRIIEEKLGSYIAILITAVIFGALHLMNPNSSLIAGLGIAVQAGILLAVAYMYSGNLWFPIAIHFAWNFVQSGIFGANVSGGSTAKALLASKIEGATWLTGGGFGPEGSVQATLFCLVAAIVLLVLCHKEGKIRKPYWKR